MKKMAGERDRQSGEREICNKGKEKISFAKQKDPIYGMRKSAGERETPNIVKEKDSLRKEII